MSDTEVPDEILHHYQAQFDEDQRLRTGLGELEQLTIKNPAHALRATWVGGSGGGITVIASPKWDGAI